MTKKLRSTQSLPSFMAQSISFLLFFAGCGTPPAPTSVYKTPFELSGKKVHLKGIDFGRGTSLAVLIHENCIPTSPNGSRSAQTHLLTLDHDFTLEELRNWAESNPCVLGVSHNQIATTEEADAQDPLLPEDPFISKQSHLRAIQALESYKIFFDPVQGIQGKVTIAVIDTGLDLKHSDLQANLWVNEKELSGQPGFDDDGDGWVDDIYGYNFADQNGDPTHQTFNDHGTHVAGLAAAASFNQSGGIGVMGQKVSIMALNVFGKNSGAETVDIDTAIRFAADHDAHVINLSIGGGGESETTAAAIAYALQRGALVVASAGNLKQNIGENFYFPASYASQYAGLISVGASNTQSATLCDFSSFGPSVVKIAAPGCDDLAPRTGLFSTLLSDHYGYKKGTSMSAPLVSGALALTYGLIRDRIHAPPLPALVEEIFTRSAHPESGLNPFINHGRLLNLKKLAEEVDQTFPYLRPQSFPRPK